MRHLARPAALLLVALCIGVTPTTVFAQSTGAEILGIALDESGGVLPGVSVTVRNVEWA